MLRRIEAGQDAIPSLYQLIKVEIMITSICIVGIVVIKFIIIQGLMRLGI
ncbi:hypothetical protein [Lutimonas sp.]